MGKMLRIWRTDFAMKSLRIELMNTKSLAPLGSARIAPGKVKTLLLNYLLDGKLTQLLWIWAGSAGSSE